MTPDKVNQADRALAAFIAGENGFAWTGQMYLDGQLDDDKIIEAIRHHRLSHSPADEGLREALAGLEDVLNDAYVRGWDDHRGDQKFAQSWPRALADLLKHPTLAALSSDGAE